MYFINVTLTTLFKTEHTNIYINQSINQSIYHPISMPYHQEGSWGSQFNLVTVTILENSLEKKKKSKKNNLRPYYHTKVVLLLYSLQQTFLPTQAQGQLKEASSYLFWFFFVCVSVVPWTDFLQIYINIWTREREGEETAENMRNRKHNFRRKS